MLDQIVNVIDIYPKLKLCVQERNLGWRINDLFGSEDKHKGVFSLFNKIGISHYLEIYLSSKILDCGFFVRLSDSND